LHNGGILKEIEKEAMGSQENEKENIQNTLENGHRGNVSLGAQIDELNIVSTKQSNIIENQMTDITNHELG